MDKEFAAILGEGQILRSEPLKKHTTFHIGGPADYYITAKNEEELLQIRKLCQNKKMPLFILGNGSNLLVSDEGFRGVVVRLWSPGESAAREGRWSFPAGTMLSKAAMSVALQGYSGFEFAAGIPGTVGGAVVMNAGAYGQEIKDCIVSARIMEPDGTIRSYTKEELTLGYRSSVIQGTERIVLEAVFEFQKSDRTSVLADIEEMNRKRREKQPLEYYSAGSTFQRPIGNYAGKLIMEAGLAGFRIGDACVSEKHCGFLINLGNASAAEMLQLINEVTDRVEQHSGIRLEPEIRFLGRFN